MRSLFWAKKLSISCALMASVFAHAQTYPDRPLTIVVPFTPGWRVRHHGAALGDWSGR